MKQGKPIYHHVPESCAKPSHLRIFGKRNTNSFRWALPRGLSQNTYMQLFFVSTFSFTSDAVISLPHTPEFLAQFFRIRQHFTTPRMCFFTALLHCSVLRVFFVPFPCRSRHSHSRPNYHDEAAASVSLRKTTVKTFMQYSVCFPYVWPQP